METSAQVLPSLDFLWLIDAIVPMDPLFVKTVRGRKLRPFVPARVDHAESAKLAPGGLETFRGALVMPLMNRGYRTGTIRFALLTGLKTGGATGSAPGEEYIHLEVMVLLMRLV